FYFPALILLLGTMLAPFEDFKQKRRWRLALLVGALGLYNFLFYIYPNSRVRDGAPLALALRANQAWSEKTVVFHAANTAAFDSLDTNNRLVRYFNPAVVWKPFNFTTLEEFEREIQAITASGGAVWLDAASFEKLAANPQTARWLADNSRQTELTLAAHRMKYVEITLNSPK
ncbi:MAG TPA: hypothetical protein VF599_01595, partial [Pyrinomonadaceae bacterium]